MKDMTGPPRPVIFVLQHEVKTYNRYLVASQTVSKQTAREGCHDYTRSVRRSIVWSGCCHP